MKMSLSYIKIKFIGLQPNRRVILGDNNFGQKGRGPNKQQKSEQHAGEAQYESNGDDQTDQPVVVVVSDEEKNSQEPETTRRVTRSSVAAVLSASKLGKQVQVQAQHSTTKETPKSSLGMQRRSSSITIGKLRDYRESTAESQTLDSRTTTNTTPSC